MFTLRDFWKNPGNTSRHIWRPSLLFLCSLLVGCSMFSRWVLAIIVIMIRWWRINKKDDDRGKIFAQGDQNLLLENILAPLQLIFITLATRFIADFLTSVNFIFLFALRVSLLASMRNSDIPLNYFGLVFFCELLETDKIVHISGREEYKNLAIDISLFCTNLLWQFWVILGN